MRKRRLMVLGGNIIQAEAVATANRLGYYVICADAHEDAPGLAIADERCNVNIMDKDAVLSACKKLRIDGIIPYCSDALAPVAAYVAEKLGLPGHPYQSVITLTRKDMFRTFLKDNDFAVPESKSFTALDEAAAFAEELLSKGYKVIMKPADSSGSRGVNIVLSSSDVESNWQRSISFSRSGRVVIEQFIEPVGFVQDGDVFVSDGDIVFSAFYDRVYNHYVSSFFAQCLRQSTMVSQYAQYALYELKRLLSLLKINNGPLNVEYILDKAGKIYFIDIGPRNGGHMIPDISEMHYGFKETENTIKAALGENVHDFAYSRPTNYSLCCFPFFYKSGVFRYFTVSEEFKRRVKRIVTFVKPGDIVENIHKCGSQSAYFYAEFETEEELKMVIEHMDDHIYAVIE